MPFDIFGESVPGLHSRVIALAHSTVGIWEKAAPAGTPWRIEVVAKIER